MDHLEILHSPTHDHRSGSSKHHMTAVLLQTSLTNLNKKRKLEAQQFGLPLPKHLCAYQTFLRKYSSLLEDIPESEHEATESGEDSNTVTEDFDSVMSIETKPSSSNCPSTSEASLDSGWSRDALYSLESRCGTKPDLYAGNECDFLEQDFGWQLGDHHHVECICVDCDKEKTGSPTEQELEEVLYSNGVIPSSFVLSSGRWKVGQQGSEEGKKKLTIDKEFEQYFGSLMLH